METLVPVIDDNICLGLIVKYLLIFLVPILKTFFFKLNSALTIFYTARNKRPVSSTICLIVIHWSLRTRSKHCSVGGVAHFRKIVYNNFFTHNTTFKLDYVSIIVVTLLRCKFWLLGNERCYIYWLFVSNTIKKNYISIRLFFSTLHFVQLCFHIFKYTPMFLWLPEFGNRTFFFNIRSSNE